LVSGRGELTLFGLINYSVRFEREGRKKKRELFKQDSSNASTFSVGLASPPLPRHHADSDDIGGIEYSASDNGAGVFESTVIDTPRRRGTPTRGGSPSRRRKTDQTDAGTALPHLVPNIAVTTITVVESPKPQREKQVPQHLVEDEEPLLREKLASPPRKQNREPPLRSPPKTRDVSPEIQVAREPEPSFADRVKAITDSVSSGISKARTSIPDLTQYLPKRPAIKIASPEQFRRSTVNLISNATPEFNKWDFYSSIVKLLLFWLIMITIWTYSWKENQTRKFKFW